MPLVAKGRRELGTGKRKPNGEEEKSKEEETLAEEDESFVLVSNIPSSWHTHHLRYIDASEKTFDFDTFNIRWSKSKLQNCLDMNLNSLPTIDQFQTFQETLQ